MKFALVNNQRQEAKPKLKGICPVCNSPVIAKCGTIKAHHWAHETKQNCKNDRWETEGQWHRNWKNQFPVEWQEQIIIVDNEKNVADIRTPKGLVIEFQHSHITPEEQKARETAYKDMLWVVDGTRLKYDFPRFQKKVKEYNKEFLKIRENIKLFSIDFYDEVFPKNWINCSVPIVFDFLGEEKEEQANVFQKYLYFLLPRNKVMPDEFSAYLLYIPRKDFIPLIKNEWELFYPKLLSSITEIQKAKSELYEKQKRMQQYYSIPIAANRFRNRRRF